MYPVRTKSGKVTQALSPHRTAFAALRYPRSGSAPWARRDGPSMAHRGSPGIHAGRPTPQNLLSASREGWKIKSNARRGGRPAGLLWRRHVFVSRIYFAFAFAVATGFKPLPPQNPANHKHQPKNRPQNDHIHNKSHSASAILEHIPINPH